MPQRTDKVTRCSICHREPVSEDFPRTVCPRCDALALNDAASPARTREDGSGGDNPVYIDAHQCWRHYHQGGYVTMVDTDNCRDFEQFCRVNRLPL